jgi:hypothetical protein
MSLYHVDKVFHDVVMSTAEAERFRADPVAYCAGRDLTDAERRALVERDYAALYALGGHPFLLFAWLRAVADIDWGTAGLPFIADYCKAIEPHGIPDFAT